MNQKGATLVGGTAVVMWGALALFTTYTGHIPPFQLVAMTFAVAFLLALGKWLLHFENPLAFLRYPWPVWVLGLGGLFGYHFFYYTALKNAPPADASLIAYMWPLLIVVFSAFLPGEKLRWYHVAGTLLGLAGSALLILGKGRLSLDPQFTLGYLAAIACALTWSTYSVLSRRFGTVPTDTVGWFCGGTAVLGFVCHLAFEPTAWPQGMGEWLAVLALGIGPVGAAFFAWDIGVKRGNIRVLGALSYLAPLISALLLVAFGRAEASWQLSVACVAIVGGALLASKEMLKRRRAATTRSV